MRGEHVHVDFGAQAVQDCHAHGLPRQASGPWSLGTLACE